VDREVRARVGVSDRRGLCLARRAGQGLRMARARLRAAGRRTRRDEVRPDAQVAMVRGALCSDAEEARPTAVPNADGALKHTAFASNESGGALALSKADIV